MIEAANLSRFRAKDCQENRTHVRGCPKDAGHNLISNVAGRFIDAMRSAGVEPADASEVVPNGILQRFDVEGDKRGSRNGWAVLHLEGIPAGAFGSWKLGIAGTWCARDSQTLSPTERAEHYRRIDLAQRQARAERAKAHAEAAARAQRLWNAAGPADPGHPYRERKAVALFGARQLNGSLVLPVRDFAGKLHSLQFIGEDGAKLLLKHGAKRGHFIPVAGDMSAPARVLICEGWATGATLAEMAPDALVLAAIDAGNLEPVAVGARKCWPNAQLIVCADADPVGITKARAAAIAAEAMVAVPEFPEGAEGSDFNDLAALKLEGAA